MDSNTATLNSLQDELLSVSDSLLDVGFIDIGQNLGQCESDEAFDWLKTVDCTSRNQVITGIFAWEMVQNSLTKRVADMAESRPFAN